MLFEMRLRDGIHDGSITTIFRRWRKPQVVAGGHYRTGLDMIEVVDIRIVAPESVTKAELRRAGYADVVALVADLHGDGGDPVYQIRVRRLDSPDPRTALAHSDELGMTDIQAIDRRLDRLDRTGGPWTRAVLAAIGAQPDTSSAVIADAFGLERLVFKRNVRKLKELGLTESQLVGYRLSPRGRAYLAAKGLLGG